MEVSVLVRVIQEVMQRLLLQCHCGQTAAHGGFFPPVFLVLLDRKSLFCCASYMECTAVLEVQ